MAQLLQFRLLQVRIAQLREQLAQFGVVQRRAEHLPKSIGRGHLLDGLVAALQLVRSGPGDIPSRYPVVFQYAFGQRCIRLLDRRVEPPPREPRNDQYQERRPDRPQDHHRPPCAALGPILERIEHGLDVGKTLFRVRGQAAIDDLRQRAVHAAQAPMGRRRWRPLDQATVSGQPADQMGGLLKLLYRLPGPVRRCPGKHAVQQSPQGINVPSGVGGRLQVGLFRGHVEQGSQGRDLLVGEPRLAKVGQPGLVVLVQQHVGRLQIAVQHPFAMGMDQPGGHVAKHLHRLVHRQRSVLQAFGQGAPVQVLHNVVGRLGIPAHPEQLDDVSVGEEKGQFFDLAAQERPVQPAAMGVELDGHPPAGVPLPRHPDLSIGPPAQEPLRLVAGHLGRRLPALQAHLARLAALPAPLRFGRIGAHAVSIADNPAGP